MQIALVVVSAYSLIEWWYVKDVKKVRSAVYGMV